MKKLKGLLLICLTLFIGNRGVTDALACGFEDFTSPEVVQALTPFLDVLKTTIEKSPPMLARGVTVKDTGTLTVDRFVTGESESGIAAIYGIRLSNGVRANFEESSNQAGVLVLRSSLTQTTYDEYGRIAVPEHCVVRIESKYDFAFLTNADSGAYFNGILKFDPVAISGLTKEVHLPPR